MRRRSLAGWWDQIINVAAFGRMALPGTMAEWFVHKRDTCSLKRHAEPSDYLQDGFVQKRLDNTPKRAADRILIETQVWKSLFKRNDDPLWAVMTCCMHTQCKCQESNGAECPVGDFLLWIDRYLRLYVELHTTEARRTVGVDCNCNNHFQCGRCKGKGSYIPEVYDNLFFDSVNVMYLYACLGTGHVITQQQNNHGGLYRIARRVISLGEYEHMFQQLAFNNSMNTIEFSNALLPPPPRGAHCGCAVCTTPSGVAWHKHIKAPTYQNPLAIPYVSLIAMTICRHIGSVERSMLTKMPDVDRRRWQVITPMIDKLLHELRSTCGDDVFITNGHVGAEERCLLNSRIVAIIWYYMSAY